MREVCGRRDRKEESTPHLEEAGQKTSVSRQVQLPGVTAESPAITSPGHTTHSETAHSVVLNKPSAVAKTWALRCLEHVPNNCPSATYSQDLSTEG